MSEQTETDPEVLEFGRWLFAQECQFMLGATSLDNLPDADLPEVAFAGRSNVGKSSLVNALTGRKTLARTSNTPGRTQQLNFFDLAGRLVLVDLPGYGFARVSKSQVAAWTDVMRSYLAGRPTLRRLFLLVDSRHGLKKSDAEMMEMLDAAAVGYQVVLTKADQPTAAALATTRQATEQTLVKHAAAFPAAAVTSALKRTGIPELRAEIAALVKDDPLH